MEKAVKTFERVNTSKGGRAIPEDQRPDCFFFVAVQCNFRYMCSHEGMSRRPSHRYNTKQHPPMRRRANNKPNSCSNQSCHQHHRHRPGGSCERELALEHYTPPLLSFRDCNFVRDTFESITSDYCPPLECNLRVVNAGLGMISVRVLLCLVLWVFYANHPQREEVFADPHRPQVKDLNSGNGFDNDRSNDETKRYAEVV
ncbi:unnamed protein product [Brassica oleracea var. botrytis]